MKCLFTLRNKIYHLLDQSLYDWANDGPLAEWNNAKHSECNGHCPDSVSQAPSIFGLHSSLKKQGSPVTELRK